MRGRGIEKQDIKQKPNKNMATPALRIIARDFPLPPVRKVTGRLTVVHSIYRTAAEERIIREVTNPKYTAYERDYLEWYHHDPLKRSTTPFGHSLGRTTGWVHRAELARHGVRMLKGVEYRRIDDAGLHVGIEGKELLVPADTIIVCAGQDPHRGIKAGHLIGGAKEAGELDAKRAMLEGAQLADRL